MVPGVAPNSDTTVPDPATNDSVPPENPAPALGLVFNSEPAASGQLQGISSVRPGSGSPIRPGIAIFPSSTSASVRARTSSGSPPPIQGALWNAYRGREERPRFERDSLRNRSVEGRPGSRKHRRWTRSVEITGSLRKAMAKCGEDPNISEAELLGLQAEVEWRPSAFYRLMETEGAHGALDALEHAERTSARPRTPRQKDAAQLADEHERRVRRTFADTWQFLQGNESARELLSKLEKEAARAFGSTEGAEDDAIALLWMVHWDGAALETKFGSAPANEMAIGGLNPTFRKVVHELARSLGLHSESRVVDGPKGAEDNKVIALRPPRRHGRKCPDAWVEPLSVAQVFARA